MTCLNLDTRIQQAFDVYCEVYDRTTITPKMIEYNAAYLALVAEKVNLEKSIE